MPAITNEKATESKSVEKPSLSRREREVMDIVYRLDHATAVAVREAMTSPPTDAAVRATLRTLVEKKQLRIEYDGPRYVYHPTLPRDAAQQSALRHLVDTFFGGSAPGAMAALLDLEQARGLDEPARERIRRLIEQATREGR